MSILSSPSVLPVSAFAPDHAHTFEFHYAGSQSVKNRAVITDNETHATVYDKTTATLKLSHTIPAGTLTAGRQYMIQIQVFDADGNKSNLSEGILFYCFSTPSFRLENMADPHRSASITLKLFYAQAENEALKSHQYLLYDQNKLPINSSNVYYTASSHTFYGLENNKSYYVRCIGETVHGFLLDTGYTAVNVVYHTIPANILFDLKNHRESGYISLTTNLTIIGYETENDNFSFKDGSVTLWDNSVTYQGGFRVEGDFVLYADAKKLPLGTFLKAGNDAFALSIVNVCGIYYCELKSGTYVLYAALPKAQLQTADGKLLTNNAGQKLEIVNMSYDDEEHVIFEVKRKNNLYGLKAYYKADYLM